MDKEECILKAMKDLKKLEENAAAAKTPEEKEDIEKDISFLKATISRAKGLLNP